MLQQQAESQKTTPPAAESQAAESGSVTPDVMTPAQVAQILQVSESDVIAAIESGELKARKIGSAYRISKASLDAFLSGG